MVDVSDKAVTNRIAVAEALVTMSDSNPSRRFFGGKLAERRCARHRASGRDHGPKRTSESDPLVSSAADRRGRSRDRANQVGGSDRGEVRTTGRTGVEMEALTAVSVGALTLYDMVKGIERGVEIGPIRLLKKSGGRSGTYAGERLSNCLPRSEGLRCPGSRGPFEGKMTTPVIVAGLLLAAVWGLYLLPGAFGDRRRTPINSTEEFDRITQVMADAQRRNYDAKLSTARDQARIRRKRVLIVLVLMAVATLVVAWRRQSLNWLLLHIASTRVSPGTWPCFPRSNRSTPRNSPAIDGVREWDESPVRVVSER